MSPNLLAEVDRALASGRVVGGGVRVWFERWSVGISCRKLDQLGDWYLLLNPGTFWRLKRGTAREEANRPWYDQER